MRACAGEREADARDNKEPTPAATTNKSPYVGLADDDPLNQPKAKTSSTTSKGGNDGWGDAIDFEDNDDADDAERWDFTPSRVVDTTPSSAVKRKTGGGGKAD